MPGEVIEELCVEPIHAPLYFSRKQVVEDVGEYNSFLDTLAVEVETIK